MLREDKNVVVEKMETDDPETTRLLGLASRSSSSLLSLEERVSGLEEQLRNCQASLARPPPKKPSFLDQILSPGSAGKSQDAYETARQAREKLFRSTQDVIDLIQKQLTTAREELAKQRVRAEHSAREARERRPHATKINVYRLKSKHHCVEFPEHEYARHSETQGATPVLITTWQGKLWWWYLDRFWWDSEGLTAEDVQALILHGENRKHATLERAKARTQVHSTERVKRSPGERQPISESVRHEVWRRDGGACVDCGSRERLEFDHIVPVSRGGSNTARNIELRCEVCNRRKAANV